MSVVRAWYGNDTYGRSVEVAERADGVFFARSYGYNGYGRAWGKWARTAPTFKTHTTNRYSGEVVEYETPQLFWGFNRMEQFSDTPRFRLPKV